MILCQIISNSLALPKGENTLTEECQDQYLEGGQVGVVWFWFF